MSQTGFKHQHGGMHFMAIRGLSFWGGLLCPAHLPATTKYIYIYLLLSIFIFISISISIFIFIFVFVYIDHTHTHIYIFNFTDYTHVCIYI